MTGLTLAALLAASTPAPKTAADAPQATAAVSKTTLHVGESFAVEVSTRGPAGATFSFPKDAGNEAVELHTAAQVPGASPAPPGWQRYDAAAFAVGDTELPPIAVPYRLPDGTDGTATTEPVKLRVESVLPKGPQQQKLADIRGPMALSIGAPFWIAVAVVALLAGAVGVWLWRRRRRRSAAAVPAAPPVAPDVEALAALDGLGASGLGAGSDYRPYYIALADIAKRYLERRLGAPVLEMTSAEMASFLRDHAHAAPFAGTMRELAGAADQIKFARGQGLADDARRHLESARRLVRELEERLRPRTEAAAEGKVA